MMTSQPLLQDEDLQKLRVQDSSEIRPTTPDRSPSPVLPLPEIPTSDLGFEFTTIANSLTSADEKIQKRASNVLKLSQENEKLKAELKRMTDRLEAAERRREVLAGKGQRSTEAQTS